MFINGAKSPSSGGYTIDNSLRFDGTDDYLSRTFSAGSSTQFLLSTWIKIPQAGTYWGALICGGDGTQTNATNDGVSIGTDGKIAAFAKWGVTGSGGWGRTWTPQYRDPSAWYHILLISDLGNGTSADKLRLYVNGSRVTGYTDTGTVGSSWPYLNVTTTTNGHVIGRFNQGGGPSYVQQYLADYYFIDGGTASDASSFGETNADGVWVPRAYTGTYGTNGFHLDFADGTSTTTLGYDAAGSNDWTLTGMTRAAGVSECWMTDTPTNNFATLNPLDSTLTLTNGNLSNTAPSSTERGARGTVFVTSGKWYYEFTFASDSGTPFSLIGWAAASQNNSAVMPSGVGADTYAYYPYDLKTYNNGVASSVYGTSASGSQILMVAYDADNGKIWWGRQGTWFGSGDPAAGTNPAYSSITTSTPRAPWIQEYNKSQNINFGQRDFAYTPPTGFKALCTANLPAGSLTTSGTFTGNSLTDGPFVWLNGNPLAMTINGNAVTFGTHADKTAGGFKVRSSSSSYNTSGSNTFSVTSSGELFNAPNTAQGNP